MIKFLYFLRVFFVSFEFLTLSIVYVGYLIFGGVLDAFLERNALNSDALNWVVLYPVGVAAWVSREAAAVLFPDEKINSVLHRWPGYWRLKMHFNVGLIYCFGAVVPCVVVWLFNFLSTGFGVAIFFAFSFASSISALSFYQASLKIKELFVFLEAS